MFVVGLTGGIGSGKSTVGDTFKKLGIPVVDADVAARYVVEKGSPALEKIQQHFGPSILQEDGTLDRQKLRALVFNQPEKKLWLESLLHPLIRQRIEQQLAEASGPYVILESPLLLETDQHKMVSRVLLVDIPEELQIIRASARDNNTEQQIKAIIDAQMPRNEKIARANDIIDNSQSPENCQNQVNGFHQNYLTLSDHR